jgi:glutamyl-tRNA synthetase
MNRKVRFAPSPTGHLHIGGLRAALFNYYFAKQNNGTFVIRIEDTDHERNKEEYTQAILDSFLWCGIQSDEEIVYQSKRQEIYQAYIKKLVASENAYYHEETDETGKKSTVLKCRVKKDRTHIVFQDIIRGEISFPIDEFEDFIIARSDGSPLYNLVVVIDDIEMGISHIIRGEEHLPNTPKQIMLYEALGAKIPQFAHLPLILGPDRKKLSKRDAATAVIDYKNEGIYPEALCMYLLRLGWAYKDQEIFTIEEIYQHFKLEDIHLAGAIFDIQKLHSVNRHFIKLRSDEALYDDMTNLFSGKREFVFEKEKDLIIIHLFRDRVNTLKELALICTKIKHYPIFEEPRPEEIAIFQNIIEQMIKDIQSSMNIKDSIKNIEKTLGYAKHTIYTALRYALLGQTDSPAILKLIDIYDQESLLSRLSYFLKETK